MDEPPFTIRIHTENNQDMDWIVRLEEVTFRQTLVSFKAGVHSHVQSLGAV